MGLDSLFPSDEKIKAKTRLDEPLKTDSIKYRIVVEYRTVGFSCPITVKGKINPFHIIKEYSVSELEDILSGKMLSYLIKDDMSKWAIERAKEMLEKLGEKARVYIDKERHNRQHYLLIEREKSPISSLKCPIDISLSDCLDLPEFFFFHGYTADELSGYMIENQEKLHGPRKKMFEDALVILSKLGQDAKMYLTDEEEK